MKAFLFSFCAVFSLPAFAAEESPVRCQQLRDELKLIKEAQRRNSTPELNERERQVHYEMQKLRCSNFDPR